MFRCLPRSTLFPYTTLFRSRGGDGNVDALPPVVRAASGRGRGVGHFNLHVNSSSRLRTWNRRAEPIATESSKTRPWNRSEEHTSELQSHSDLVCRLLLEKKK